MPQNKRHIVLERRHKVSELYRQGIAQFKIAEQVGMSKGQITKDLQAIRKEWLLSSIRDFDTARAEELAKIDLLEAEYWQAWSKSKEDFEKKKKKYVDAKQKELSTEEIVLFGDPRFLLGIERCIDRRCKILGLDAPDKLDHTSKGEKLQQSVIIIPSNNREKETPQNEGD